MRLAFSRQIPVALWTVFCLTSPPTDARKPFLTAHIVHQKSETGKSLTSSMYILKSKQPFNCGFVSR